MIYVITKLDLSSLDISIIDIKNNKDTAITTLYKHLETYNDKQIELEKVDDEKSIINVYRKDHGYLYSKKTLLFKYDILEFNYNKKSELTKALQHVQEIKKRS